MLADALARGARLAEKAVTRPQEGTMLTVLAAAADGAAAAGSDRLDAVAVAAVEAAATALRATPDQLPELARAGVVDAGGLGLVVVLDALAAVATGRAPAARPGGAGGGLRAAGRARLGEPGRPRIRGHVPARRLRRRAGRRVAHGARRDRRGGGRGRRRYRRRHRDLERARALRRHRSRARSRDGGGPPARRPGRAAGRAGRVPPRPRGARGGLSGRRSRRWPGRPARTSWCATARLRACRRPTSTRLC